MNDFITDLFSRRLNDEIGGLGVRTVELYGGMVIEPTAFEPDPTTFRGEYYYNATSNALFKKIVVRKEFTVLSAYWQRVSA